MYKLFVFMLPRSEQLLNTQFRAEEARFVLLDEFPQKKKDQGQSFLFYFIFSKYDVRYPLYCITEGPKKSDSSLGFILNIVLVNGRLHQ